MLDLEFYLVNATSVLLWLFQTCPHEVLLGLIALGALCVLVSVIVFVFRTVVISFYLVRFLLFYLPHGSVDLFVGIVRYALWNGRASGSLSYPLFDLPQPPEPPAPHNSSHAAPLRSALSRQASLLRLPSENHRLSLPQTLALHSNQWSAIEASRSVSPDSIADGPSSLSIDPSSVETRVPPRRSNRVRARHLRMRDTCVCSS